MEGSKAINTLIGLVRNGYDVNFHYEDTTHCFEITMGKFNYKCVEAMHPLDLDQTMLNVDEMLEYTLGAMADKIDRKIGRKTVLVWADSYTIAERDMRELIDKLDSNGIRILGIDSCKYIVNLRTIDIRFIVNPEYLQGMYFHHAFSFPEYLIKELQPRRLEPVWDGDLMGYILHIEKGGVDKCFGV